MSLRPRGTKQSKKQSTKKQKKEEHRKQLRLSEIREKKGRGEGLTPEEIMFLKRNKGDLMCESILRKMTAAERRLFELEEDKGGDRR